MKKEEPKKEEHKEKAAPIPSDVAKCECGEPVAVELGQTSVCKKHIKVS